MSWFLVISRTFLIFFFENVVTGFRNILLAISDTTAVWCSVTMVCRSFKGRELPLHDKHPRKICILYCSSYVQLSQ